MYKIGICDDDYAFCGQIEQYLENAAETLSLTVEPEIFLSAEDYLKYLSENPPLDILFLDIELGQTDGIAVGQKIRAQLENEVTQIVYVSAKEHYAIRLFQNRPMDFLVKPITQSDVDRVLSQYQRLFAHKKNFFEYCVGKSVRRIAENDIMYFQCESRKIRIFTNRKTDEAFYAKMAELDNQLNHDKFLAIHKSYIVNTNYVSEYRPKEVIMTSGAVLPISQAFRKEVQQRVLKMNQTRSGEYGTI